MKIIHSVSFLALFFGVATGLRCFRCAGCSEGGESVSNKRDAQDCPEPYALCLISQESSNLIEGGCCRGQGRRSCTNGSEGIAGECRVTPYQPADSWYEKQDAYGNETFTTCYCNDQDGCNGSEGFLTSSLWSLGLTIITAFVLY